MDTEPKKYVLSQPNPLRREFHVLRHLNGRYLPFAVLTDLRDARWLVDHLNAE